MANVAVVGATGAVGSEMLRTLEERGFGVRTIRAFASARSIGQELEFMGDTLKVEELKPGVFKNIDIALFSAGSAVSKQFAPLAAQEGTVVIDNSSHFRMEQDVPLVIPEVNPQDIAQFKARRIIANPNCSAIQVIVAVWPLAAVIPLKRMVVSTYQAVSGAGAKGIDELETQIRSAFNHKDIEPHVFAKQIAFNCLPMIGALDEHGDTSEELKMVQESRKIMHLPELAAHCTCVRVPVFNGHSTSVNLEFEKPISVIQAREILRQAKGVLLIEDKGDFPTPLKASGQDATLVGRLRKDTSVAHGISLFCCADNLRKGAATNAVQIAELLLRDYL